MTSTETKSTSPSCAIDYIEFPLFGEAAPAAPTRQDIQDALEAQDERCKSQLPRERAKLALEFATKIATQRIEERENRSSKDHPSHGGGCWGMSPWYRAMCENRIVMPQLK